MGDTHAVHVHRACPQFFRFRPELLRFLLKHPLNPFFRQKPIESAEDEFFNTLNIGYSRSYDYLPSVQEHHPMPKGRRLEMLGIAGEEQQIPFNEFMGAAEYFGGQMLDGMNKLVLINDKHYEHLTQVNATLESGFKHLSDTLATSLHNFMTSSNAKVDAISTEVNTIKNVLSSMDQTMNS
ncbi:unnamed protein product [Cuscuta europaea]|uniref:Uncharacterized protein n=1 Tax=Cuscuta europaea TaxID=41803 RepID=A0A9P1E5Z6_CUSEU|nr:unnamed protein product [Cuscuta europaea]